MMESMILLIVDITPKQDMNHQDSVKLPSSQSFAKSTLSTQMKSTHKPVETIAKPLSQTSYPSIKSWTSNPSKGQDASFVRSVSFPVGCT